MPVEWRIGTIIAVQLSSSDSMSLSDRNPNVSMPPA